MPVNVTGFWVDRSIPGLQDMITVLPGAPGVAFSEGDACVIDGSNGATAGLLIQASAQTTSPRYIVLSVMAQSGPMTPGAGSFPTGPLRQSTYNTTLTAAAGGSYVEVLDCAMVPGLVLATQFATATFDGTACNTNSTKSQILFSDGAIAGGATNNYTGGTVYVQETGQQFIVTADSYASPVHTLTIWPTPAVAITNTNTIRIVQFGPGCVKGQKLQSSNPQQGISTALGDNTGGHILIHDVDLARRIAYVRFSGSGIIGV